MKQSLIFPALILPLFALAQSGTGIHLAKGNKIQVVKKVTMDMDLGMSLKQQSTDYHSLDVLDSDEKNIQVKHVLTRSTMEVDAMGRTETYDSDKAADRDSDLGKNMPADMFLPDTMLVDKRTGEPVNQEKNDQAKSGQDDNPMDAMMQAMSSGNKSSIINELLFVLPSGIKPGEQWMDSVIEKGVKKRSTYTLTEIKDQIAVVSLTEKMDISTDTEMQGMSMQINLNSTNQSTLRIATASGLLISKESKIDMSGSLEVMGQNQPITAQANASLLVTQ